jgi:hypothetical protein
MKCVVAQQGRSTPSNGRLKPPFALDGRDRIREAIEAEWPRRGTRLGAD